MNNLFIPILSGFFSYKKDFDNYHGEDQFSPAHIIFMVFATIALIILPILLRNVKKEKITRYLKVMAILMFFWEGIKIIWETHYDLKYDGHFNICGLLPLYLCSMFIYVLPFAAYGKNKVKRCALGFLTSLGIIGGLSNLYLTRILGEYPLFSYATFVSLGFHFLMAFTGLWLLSSSYFVPEKKDYIYAYLPTVAFAIIVAPIAYILQSKGYGNDYMLLLHGWGIPLIQDLSNQMIQNHLQWLFSLLMMGIFFIVTAIMIGLVRFIQNTYYTIKIKNKKTKN